MHAARNANGDLSVELINEDPATPIQVNLNYDGWAPSSATPTVYTYGAEATSITTAQQGTASTQVIPPYSIVTLKLTPSATNPVNTTLTAPGDPDGQQRHAHTARPSPGRRPPAAPSPATRYTSSSAPTASCSASRPPPRSPRRTWCPGPSYTLNVLATDQKGYLSMPSQPVTFITGTPQDSTCAVSYDVGHGWASGFVANITITEHRPQPHHRMDARVQLPRRHRVGLRQHLERHLRRRRPERDGHSGRTGTPTLPPTAATRVNFGFVGNQTGANPSPASFTLNGTVCTTTYS